MKKRILSILLVLLMAFELVPTALADTTQTLEDGKSYVLKSSVGNSLSFSVSGDNLTYDVAVFDRNDLLSYYERDYASTSFFTYANGTIYLTAHGSGTLTVPDGVTVTASSEPALQVITLSANKSYKITSDNIEQGVFFQNKSNEYVTFDLVQFSSDGSVTDYNSATYGDINIDPAGSAVVTVGSRDLEIWYPTHWKDIVTVAASSEPALDYYTFAPKTSYIIRNSDIYGHSVRTSVDGNHKCDYAIYSLTGGYSDFYDRNTPYFDNRTIPEGGHAVVTALEGEIRCWVPHAWSSYITVAEHDKPAFHTIVLKAGHNYKLTNSNIDTDYPVFTNAGGIRDFSAAVYYHDGSIWYAAENRASFNTDLQVTTGGYSVFTIGEADIECWMPYEWQNYLRLYECSEPALAYFTLSANKHYRIDNEDIDNWIELNSNGDSNRLMELVLYNPDGSMNYESAQYSSSLLNLVAGGHFGLSVKDYDVVFWIPYRFLNTVKVYEVGEPAFFSFNVRPHNTYTFRNSDTEQVHYIHKIDDNKTYTFTRYFTNGDVDVAENISGSGDVMIWSEAETKVTVGDNEFTFYIPVELYGKYVTAYTSDGTLITMPNYPATKAPVSPDTNVTNQNGVREHYYDTVDPGDDLVLPVEELETVTDAASAGKAVTVLTDSMTPEQKDSATGTDLATLYAEVAAMNAASADVTGKEIMISKATVSPLMEKSSAAMDSVSSALISGAVTTARAMASTVLLTTQETGEITIKIDPDVLETDVDKIRIETPAYAITLKLSDLAVDLTDVIVIKASAGGGSGGVYDPVTWAPAPLGGTFFRRPQPVETSLFAGAGSTGASSVTLTMPGGGLSNPVTVSFPSDGESIEETVVDSKDNATTSKYNPATMTMDGKISDSGTYTTKENAKDFTDIQDKSVEMQEAIRFLASKGIITGFTETTFAPDDSISRAQIATLIIKALGKLDDTAKSTFKDVKSSDWYNSSVASCVKNKILNGYEDNTFLGNKTILKQEILKVASNVLIQEMGYRVPANGSPYLSRYSEKDLANWILEYLPLVTRENLVLYRVDGTFSGGMEMTRGDVAIIIYRLFQRIW